MRLTSARLLHSGIVVQLIQNAMFCRVLGFGEANSSEYIPLAAAALCKRDCIETADSEANDSKLSSITKVYQWLEDQSAGVAKYLLIRPRFEPHRRICFLAQFSPESRKQHGHNHKNQWHLDDEARDDCDCQGALHRSSLVGRKRQR